MQPSRARRAATAATALSCPDGAGWSRNGEWRCPSQADSQGRALQNVDKQVNESDSVYRVNLTWKATDTALLYATWSEGYRPGGINRNPVRCPTTSRTS